MGRAFNCGTGVAGCGLGLGALFFGGRGNMRVKKRPGDGGNWLRLLKAPGLFLSPSTAATTTTGKECCGVG